MSDVGGHGNLEEDEEGSGEGENVWDEAVR